MAEQEVISEFLLFPSTSTSQDEGECFKWSHSSTLMFLDLYEQYRKQVGTFQMKNLKKMFDAIAKELRYKTQQNITAANCENRWKHLERMYKKFIDNNNKTGRARRDFEYAEMMHQILGKRKNINPIILLSSDTVRPLSDTVPPLSEEEPNTAIVDSNMEKENIATNEMYGENMERGKKVASVRSDNYKKKKLRIEALKEMRNDRKDYYQKLLQLKEKKLNEKIRKNNILVENNAILKQGICDILQVLQNRNT